MHHFVQLSLDDINCERYSRKRVWSYNRYLKEEGALAELRSNHRPVIRVHAIQVIYAIIVIHY